MDAEIICDVGLSNPQDFDLFVNRFDPHSDGDLRTYLLMKVKWLQRDLASAKIRSSTAESSKRLKHINCLLLRSKLKRLVLAKAFEALLRASQRYKYVRKICSYGIGFHHLSFNCRPQRSRSTQPQISAIFHHWSEFKQRAEMRRAMDLRKSAKLSCLRARRWLLRLWGAARQRRVWRTLRRRAHLRHTQARSMHLVILMLQWRLAVVNCRQLEWHDASDRSSSAQWARTKWTGLRITLRWFMLRRFLQHVRVVAAMRQACQRFLHRRHRIRVLRAAFESMQRAALDLAEREAEFRIQLTLWRRREALNFWIEHYHGASETKEIPEGGVVLMSQLEHAQDACVRLVEAGLRLRAAALLSGWLRRRRAAATLFRLAKFAFMRRRLRRQGEQLLVGLRRRAVGALVAAARAARTTRRRAQGLVMARTLSRWRAAVVAAASASEAGQEDTMGHAGADSEDVRFAAIEEGFMALQADKQALLAELSALAAALRQKERVTATAYAAGRRRRQQHVAAWALHQFLEAAASRKRRAATGARAQAFCRRRTLAYALSGWRWEQAGARWRHAAKLRVEWRWNRRVWAAWRGAGRRDAGRWLLGRLAGRASRLELAAMLEYAIHGGREAPEWPSGAKTLWQAKRLADALLAAARGPGSAHDAGAPMVDGSSHGRRRLMCGAFACLAAGARRRGQRAALRRRVACVLRRRRLRRSWRRWRERGRQAAGCACQWRDSVACQWRDSVVWPHLPGSRGAATPAATLPGSRGAVRAWAWRRRDGQARPDTDAATQRGGRGGSGSAPAPADRDGLSAGWASYVLGRAGGYE
jgi:hypothetical protein